MNDNLTTNASNEAESPAFLVGAVSRSPLSPEDEEKRQQALKRVEDAYQDRDSPHYRDNERFSWAVETINRRFFERIATNSTYVTIENRKCTIKSGNYGTKGKLYSEKLYFSKTFFSSQNTIEAVYNACVEFVKWYNNSQLKNDRIS
jgi:hypothetical protein